MSLASIASQGIGAGKGNRAEGRQKSMYSPQSMLSSKFRLRGRVRPSEEAVPVLCGVPGWWVLEFGWPPGF